MDVIGKLSEAREVETNIKQLAEWICRARRDLEHDAPCQFLSDLGQKDLDYFGKFAMFGPGAEIHYPWGRKLDECGEATVTILAEEQLEVMFTRTGDGSGDIEAFVLENEFIAAVASDINYDFETGVCNNPKANAPEQLWPSLMASSVMLLWLEEDCKLIVAASEAARYIFEKAG